MAKTQSVAQIILQYNAGRDPERLALKLRALRKDPFAFLRGTCHLFYASLPRDAALAAAPAVTLCGDLHLENFGAYKGDNRLAYFDVNDLDEAALAPYTFDVLRLLASIQVAARPLDLKPKFAAALCRGALEAYRAAIADGKARWVERSTASGLVLDLFTAMRQRNRKQLLDERTTLPGKTRRLRIDGKRALACPDAERARVTAMLAQCPLGTRDPAFYKVLDVARRIAGTGSLGLERWVLLVEGKGSPDNNYLLDLKQALPSAVAPYSPVSQHAWWNDAERIVASQRQLQAMAPARLAAVAYDGKAYVLKELQPGADRLDLEAPGVRKEHLEETLRTMGEVAAWAHLRGTARWGAASIEELQASVAAAGWDEALIAHAGTAAAQVVVQWQSYCVDYDAGLVK